MSTKIYQNKLVLFLFLMCTINFTNTKNYKVLFCVSKFPHVAQPFIIDQIIGLIDKGQEIAIHAFMPHNESETYQKEVDEYNLLSYTTYGATIPNLHEVDIVYVQLGNHGPKVLKQLQQCSRKPKFVLCFQGDDATRYLKDDPNIYDEVFKEADCVVPICNYLKSKLLKVGCPKKKIFTYYLGIDIEKFQFNPDRFKNDKQITLLSVGRITPKKGFQYVIESLPTLQKEYPSITYHIIGDARETEQEYKQYLIDLVKEKKLKETVVFKGWLPHEKVAEAMSQADIFLLTSTPDQYGAEEGLPTVLKEAMAIGIPVIATKHAGNSELITHGKTGFLLKEPLPKAISTTITYILHNKTKIFTLAQKARTVIENKFNIKTQIDILNNKFIELIN